MAELSRSHMVSFYLVLTLTLVAAAETQKGGAESLNQTSIAQTATNVNGSSLAEANQEGGTNNLKQQNGSDYEWAANDEESGSAELQSDMGGNESSINETVPSPSLNSSNEPTQNIAENSTSPPAQMETTGVVVVTNITVTTEENVPSTTVEHKPPITTVTVTEVTTEATSIPPSKQPPVEISTQDPGNSSDYSSTTPTTLEPLQPAKLRTTAVVVVTVLISFAIIFTILFMVRRELIRRRKEDQRVLLRASSISSEGYFYGEGEGNNGGKFEL